MRNEWGCTYFKLDANFWGAIHGGRFHDPRATRIEAYRRGMEAVLRGTRDAFVLGCNHPIWPSLGLIHGSRSSHDIRRDWKRIADTARQNLMRNWQNGRLWWNDPDAIVLTGDLPEEEFRFHATAIYATGGMILSGDDLTTIRRRGWRCGGGGRREGSRDGSGTTRSASEWSISRTSASPACSTGTTHPKSCRFH